MLTVKIIMPWVRAPAPSPVAGLGLGEAGDVVPLLPSFSAQPPHPPPFPFPLRLSWVPFLFSCIFLAGEDSSKKDVMEETTSDILL